MERYGIEWEQLGTHREHLSVLNYKKEERTKEVDRLDNIIQDRTLEINELNEKIGDTKNEIWQLKTEKH